MTYKFALSRSDGNSIKSSDIVILNECGFLVSISEQTVVLSSTQPYYYLRDEPVDENSNLRKKIYEKPLLLVPHDDILSTEDVTLNNFPAVKFTYKIQMEIHFVYIESSSLENLLFFLMDNEGSYFEKSNVLTQDKDFYTALVLGR